MSRAGVYFHTVRRMLPAQILSLIGKRIYPFGSRVLSPPLVHPRGIDVATAFVIPNNFQTMEDSVTFLNHKETFQGGHFDWCSTRLPKLWRYNLHYFDFLLWPAVIPNRKAEILDSWIGDNPLGAEDAWEPYTVSLRVVNWIKYFSLLDSHLTLPRDWHDSLAMQAAWLERNLETHILANHYLKNAKALVFAGTFFKGSVADRWLRQGIRIFSEQVREQFLSSGAHYELSPMYHSICAEDLLDVLNIARGNPGLFTNRFASLVESRASCSLDFLSAILMPDGKIPLFNDAAFGIAPEPEGLFNYGKRLFGYCLPESTVALSHDAGYFVLGSEDNRMIVDCGPVRPAYQPGHTHCDMLSYELVLAGRRVAVDAGVYDYENSEERRYCRSTRAHNTVCVDGEEQSEVWGVFRVARRARVVQCKIFAGDNGAARFVGEIEGFPRIWGGIRHCRSIDYDGTGCWCISDQVIGHGVHRVDTYIHLDPGLDPRLTGEGVVIEDGAHTPVARIRPEGSSEFRVDKGWHFPEFGKKQVNCVLRLSVEDRLPATLGYRVEKA